MVVVVRKVEKGKKKRQVAVFHTFALNIKWTMWSSLAFFMPLLFNPHHNHPPKSNICRIVDDGWYASIYSSIILHFKDDTTTTTTTITATAITPMIADTTRLRQSFKELLLYSMRFWITLIVQPWLFADRI